MNEDFLSTNHKGTYCHYKPILCQEGYCQDCQIYSDWIGHQRYMGRKDANNEVCEKCGQSRTALREMIAEGGRGNLTMVEIVTGNCPACKKALGGK